MRIEGPRPTSGFGISSVFHPQSTLLSGRASVFSHQSSFFLFGISSILSPHSSILFSHYCRMALRRLDGESGPLFARASIEYRTAADLLAPANVPAVADAPTRRPARARSPRRHLTGA